MFYRRNVIKVYLQKKEAEGSDDKLPQEIESDIVNVTQEKLAASVYCHLFGCIIFETCILQALSIAQIKKVRVLIDQQMIDNAAEIERLEKERHVALIQIGNIVHHTVPISDDEV